MTDPSEPLPILIGLSGKRDLRGQEAALRIALTQAFTALDEAFSHAPKVLVNGLAEGADILSAETALERPGWRVMGLLPLPMRDYLATMSSDACRARFRNLTEDPRVRYRTLAALNLNTTADRSYEIRDRSETSLHYEQLGLWLAEHCAVLFAILISNESANRPGGSSRVALQRLRGSPDALGRAVIDVSAELARHPVLDPPHPQAVWRIEIAEAAETAVLSSAILDAGSAVATQMPMGRDELAARFPLARDINGFNQRARVCNADWPQTTPEATSLLMAYRTTLSRIQATFQIYWKRSIWGLSIAFVVALLLFEAFAKLTSDFSFVAVTGLSLWAMPLYVVIVACAVGLYVVAASNSWQSLHEDYRAINEVLRVQLAWWMAGLTAPTDRADHYYLLGTSAPLAGVRHCAAAMITWTRIFAGLPREDWSGVRGGSRSYVEGQLNYFRNRSIERERALHVVSVSSWYCFSLAYGIAAWLAVYAMHGDIILAELAHTINERTSEPAFLAWLLTGCVLVVRLLSPWQRSAFLQTILPGVLIGFFALGFAMYDLGHNAAPNLATAGKAMVFITMVTLLAIAGGVRFVAEKLAWEAEALAYHEAHTRFAHGARLMNEIDAANQSDDEKRQQKQVVIHELGFAALAENEAWLRAHRERPIEPVLGG